MANNLKWQTGTSQHKADKSRSSLLSRLSLAGLSCTIFFPLFGGGALAQIAADKNAPAQQRPSIHAAPNGVPMVDIAAPNRRGLSHNKYHDFNIGEPGAILNNYRGEAGRSQLGGVVPGNPNLRNSDSARAILNEVTSGNRSALRGAAEVFGPAAAVIIANPNGITCDGCGFINTPRASLTTGTPLIGADGSLQGFDVRGGDISFGPKGANLRSGSGAVDIFDVVSRRVVFNGSVAAHDMNIAAGTGKYDYAAREMKELTDIVGKPQYAIDGAELGALQADKIKIVATEKGVGVRMRADMAAHAGQITLSADGKISLNNLSGRDGAAVRSASSSVAAKRITAKKKIHVQAARNIALQSADAEGDIVARAGGGISAPEHIIGNGAVQLASGAAIKAGIIAAGSDLSARADGEINVQAAIADRLAELSSAHGDITAANGAQAGGDLRLRAAEGAVQAGELISQGNMDLQAAKALTVGSNAVAQGNLTANAGSISVKNGQLGAHGDLSVRTDGEINVQAAIADRLAELSSTHGDITAANGAQAGGDLRLAAAEGAVSAGELISRGNMDLLAAKALDVSGNAIAQGRLTAQAGEQIQAGGAVIAGMDIAASNAAADGGLVMRAQGEMQLNSGGALAAKSLVSGGAMNIRAGDGISYEQLVSYNSAYLRADRGNISIDKRTAAAGDISLTAQALDLSNNRSHISTGQTLTLNADNVALSHSQMAYGGLTVNSSGGLNIAGAEIGATQSAGGTGDINFNVADFSADAETDILAERSLTMQADWLDNSGRMAADNVSLRLRNGGVNRASGLIYAAENGEILTDQTFRNEFGAIIAEANLIFAGAGGASAAGGAAKSAGLTNLGGLIQAGNALTVKTQSLVNDADVDPYITTAHQQDKYSFDKPAHYEKLGEFRGKYSNSLFHDTKTDQWGAGQRKKKGSGLHPLLKDKYYHRVGETLYGSKEDAFSPIDLPDGTHYRADNWVYDDTHEKRIVEYKLNNKASMSVLTDTDTIHNKPSHQGLMQAGGDLQIDADKLANRYSAIEAGGNAAITAGSADNLGVAAHKIISDKCNSAGATCYAYNADGSRNNKGDIAKGAALVVSNEIIDTVSGVIQAAGLLDIKAGSLSNSSAPGSVAGSAPFEKKPVSGDPLSALNGMTAGGALFTDTTKVSAAGAMNAAAGGAMSADAARAPRPDAGGFGGTLPGQNFVYETRAKFLDVGKFYGSAYFLKHIGYRPEQQVLFLGDAYFENQLIDKQMRDLAGEGLGHGSFIPGDSATEQMKALLDRGSDYMQANGLAFGRGLTAAQAAALDKSIVIYVRQELNGQAVYAPVLYMPAAERAARSGSGAHLSGGGARIAADKLVNSGQVSSAHNMEIRANEILAPGGGFAASGDLALVSAGDLRLSGQKVKLGAGGAEAALTGASVSAGGNALLQSGGDLALAGAGVFAGGDLGMNAGGDLRIGAMEARNKGRNISGLNDSAESLSRTGSAVASGGSQYLSAGRDIAISGSDVLAGGDVNLDAGGRLAISAAQREAQTRFSGRETAAEVSQRGASLAAGGDLRARSGGAMAITASDLAAGKNAALQAGGDLRIGAAQEHREHHIAQKGFKENETADYATGSTLAANGDLIARAGGAPAAGAAGHGSLSVAGSAIAAGGQAALRAADDLNISAAENSYHYDVKAKSGSGGPLGGSSKMARTEDVSSLNSSQISGGKGAAMQAGRDLAITASDVAAGDSEHQADILAKAGGDIRVSGAKETRAASSSSSGAHILSKESKKQQSYDENVIGARLGATGDIIMQTDKNIAVKGSEALAGDDIALRGNDVSIAGIAERHESSSQHKKSGFETGTSAGGGSASARVGYGAREDKKREETIRTAQSRLSAGHDINVDAGHDAALEGAQLAAGRDINIAAGNDVNITAATDEYHMQQSHKESFAGITGTVSSSVLGRLDTARQAIERIDRGGNVLGNLVPVGMVGLDYMPGVKGKIIGAGKTVVDKIRGGAENPSADKSKGGNEHYTTDDGKTPSNLSAANNQATKEANAAQDRKQAAAAAAQQNKGAFDRLADLGVSVNVSAGYSASKSKSSSDSYIPVGSEVNAGRAAHITAKGGNAHIQGSDIKAGGNETYANDATAGDVSIKAAKDITIESAQERLSNRSSSKSSGASIGYDLASGGITANGNYSKSKSNSDSVIQHNSHITGTGTVSLDSGNDTDLRGAQVSGKKVIADIGGDLNIENRQDIIHARNKSDSYSAGTGADKARNAGQAYNMGDWNAGYSKDRSKYDYASVIEQSGIYAGEGGFDIKVKNNTDLKGAVIASEAAPEKNRLETGTLHTSDIENYAHAEAKTEGFGWTGGLDPLGTKKYEPSAEDAKANAESLGPRWNGARTITGREGKGYWDGKYGAGKNIISNLTDNGSASKNTHGETKSAVAAGTVIITDAEGQKAKTGLTPEESIARLRRDTEGTQTAAAQIDVSKLEQEAQDERAMKKAITDETFKKSDIAYEAMFNQASDVYQPIVDKDGKPILNEKGEALMRKLTDDEVKALKASGKYDKLQVFTNGIKNSETYAALKAVQTARDKDSPVYFVYAPEASNTISEVMVAGYTKVFDNDYFEMTNATKKMKGIIKDHINGNLDIAGHSRGAMTVRNAAASLGYDNKKNGVDTKWLDGADITLYGSAANGDNTYKIYKDLGGSVASGHFQMENHVNDPVAKWFFIGNNPSSYGEKGSLWNRGKEEARALFGLAPSTHGCVGDGAPANCGKFGPRKFIDYSTVDGKVIKTPVPENERNITEKKK